MLYSAAICDDESNQIKIIDGYLMRFSMKTNIEFTVKRFSCGEDLVKHCADKANAMFDIIFLDVEMKGLNGIQTAEKIRALPERNVLIAFITNYPEYMQDSFDVQASQYFTKPLTYELFEEKLRKMLNYLSELETNITVFSLKEGEIVLHLEDIVCFETEKKPKLNLLITTTSEELIVKGRIADFENSLKDKYFISVHRSVLANMRYIKRFNAETVEFTTGKVSPLSRRKAVEIKDAFSRYMVMRYKR
jgi:DNA-binding LytR/AlgR family response regulator